MKHKVTKDEELAYRLCHHEFAGHTVKAAAVIMNVKPSKVYRLLASLKKKAPQLFPILTQKQYAVYKLYLEGLTQSEIAESVNRSQSDIQATLKRVKQAGFPMLDARMETVRYNPNMDKYIKHKF